MGSTEVSRYVTEEIRRKAVLAVAASDDVNDPITVALEAVAGDIAAAVRRECAEDLIAEHPATDAGYCGACGPEALSDEPTDGPCPSLTLAYRWLSRAGQPVPVYGQHKDRARDAEHVAWAEDPPERW